VARRIAVYVVIRSRLGGIGSTSAQRASAPIVEQAASISGATLASPGHRVAMNTKRAVVLHARGLKLNRSERALESSPATDRTKLATIKKVHKISLPITSRKYSRSCDNPKIADDEP